jgi:hypothetical protein
MNMKLTAALAATLSLMACAAMAQDNGQPTEGQPPEGGQGGGMGHRPPPFPLISVLDANHDHVIDADEIANASAALLKLDTNGDGILTTNEYLPTPPPRKGGDNKHARPLPAIVKALDVNGDGVIDATEIANAPAALKKLDKNGDGKLTREEFDGNRPPRMQGGRGNHQNPGEDAPPGPPEGGQGEQ